MLSPVHIRRVGPVFAIFAVPMMPQLMTALPAPAVGADDGRSAAAIVNMRRSGAAMYLQHAVAVARSRAAGWRRRRPCTRRHGVHSQLNVRVRRAPLVGHGTVLAASATLQLSVRSPYIRDTDRARGTVDTAAWHVQHAASPSAIGKKGQCVRPCVRLPANSPKWGPAHRQQLGLRCPTDATLGSSTQRIDSARTLAMPPKRQKSVRLSFGPSHKSLTNHL